MIGIGSFEEFFEGFYKGSIMGFYIIALGDI